MFGAAGGVQNFNILGNTHKYLALSNYKIPSTFVHCQLYDVPIAASKKVVGVKNSATTTYINLCRFSQPYFGKRLPKF